MSHLKITYLLPPDLEDLFVADLFAAGTLGVESAGNADGRLRVSAWFPAASSDTALEIDEAGWERRGVEIAARQIEPDVDWLALWRERAQPFAVAAT
ncbi:MAG TPA: hypothetical protein VMM92_15845, partial [Thermoanaerobaculia bacterium]|nr:hypothetical protein [Thermoanaerobaculia bacterium]